jgi:hypothetical protein
MTIESAGAEQTLNRDRRLQLVTDHVLEVEPLKRRVLHVVSGVQHRRQTQPRDLCPEGIQ